MSETVTGFCIQCGHHFDTFDGLTQCPNCGTSDPPCMDTYQVNISINWHELAVLCIWAERWGHEKVGGAGVVYSITERIRKQHPEMAIQSPLTLSGQINQARDAGHSIQTNIKGMDKL